MYMTLFGSRITGIMRGFDDLESANRWRCSVDGLGAGEGPATAGVFGMYEIQSRQSRAGGPGRGRFGSRVGGAVGVVAPNCECAVVGSLDNLASRDARLGHRQGRSPRR